MLERRFDPAEVRRLHLYLHPVVVGGGTPVLTDGVRLDLGLRSERRFGGGAVHLAYAVRREAGPPR